MAIAYKDYLIDADQGYDENKRSETWVLTHAIPRDTWDTDAWGSMPARGAAAPATYPTGLGVSGVLLQKRVAFKSKPGWVIVTLIYGFDFTGGEGAVNKGYIITRTVLYEEKITHAYTAGGVKTQMVGPVAAANGEVIKQEYGITPGAGYDERGEKPYQLIRIHSFLNATGLNTYAGELLPHSGSLNENAWTILGKVIAVGQMKYEGSTVNFYRALSATTALYTADFDFIVHPYTWQKTVRRTLYDIGTRAVSQWQDDGTVEGKRVVKALKVQAAGNDLTDYVAYGTHDFATTLGALLT